jgi:hypothetical protein
MGDSFSFSFGKLRMGENSRTKNGWKKFIRSPT